MITRIDVTEDDIRDGEACKTSRCMVALAIARVLEPRQRIAVCQMGVTFLRGEKVLELLPLPKTVRAAITAFDTWKMFPLPHNPTPEPFSFEIDIPAQYLRFDVPVMEPAWKQY